MVVTAFPFPGHRLSTYVLGRDDSRVRFYCAGAVPPIFAMVGRTDGKTICESAKMPGGLAEHRADERGRIAATAIATAVAKVSQIAGVPRSSHRRFLDDRQRAVGGCSVRDHETTVSCTPRGEPCDRRSLKQRVIVDDAAHRGTPSSLVALVVRKARPQFVLNGGLAVESIAERTGVGSGAIRGIGL